MNSYLNYVFLDTKKIIVVDVMHKGSRDGSKSRHRSSKSSVSSVSSSRTGQGVSIVNPVSTVHDDVFDFDNPQHQSVSQPATLQRDPKDHSVKSRSKYDSPHVGGGSLPRSPFFGSRKKEKGGLLNKASMLAIVSNDTGSIICKLNYVKHLNVNYRQ